MKKPLVGLTLGLFALLFMLSSAVWAVSANEHYQVGEDVQSNQAQITQGNLLSFNKDNKQTLYTPLNGGATDGQWLDFVEAWQLAADQGGAVTLQQDVLVTAADAPEGIFAQVPEDGQILLNLNGHRLVGEEVPCLIYVGARGKLTVTDSEQGGGQILGVVYPDDSADDENEWGQIELLGGVKLPAARRQQARVMALADGEAEAEYYESNNTSDNPDYSGSFVEAWNKAATSSGTVKLLTNVNVAQCRFDTGYLLVPENKNITLDLNGCDIERGIVGQPKADGYVIRVAQNGTLTVKDQNDKGINDSGSIINGHNEGDGGCIYVESLGKLYLQSGELGSNNATGNGGAVYLETHAYFEMTGGYINLNDAYGSGGAIYMANNANFNMEGGIITQNKVNTVGESGGAVYANNSLAISVSGSAKIYENVSKKDGLNNKYDNVYLKNGLTINVSTALNDDAVIGITTETKPTDGNPVVVVEGTNLVASKFVSDDEQYETVLENSKIVLKAVAYQAEYTKDGTTKKGTFEAMWNLAAADSGTVKLLDNVTAVGGSFGSGIGFECNKTSTSSTLLKGLIFVPDDKNITLDLNGKTINRGLTSMVDGGEVIRVDGTLTIDDSSGNNSGVITGGYGNDFGGIHVYGIKSPASLTMNGGTIRDNKSSRYGSGVLLAGNTTFNMNGGSIENNTVVSSTEQDGGGVYIIGGAQFNLSGKVNIINNTIQIGAENKQKNVFLAQGYNSTIINVVNSLDTTSKIGITLEEKPTDDTPKNIVSGKSSLSLSNFVSDDTNYYLTIKSNVYNNKTISLNKMPAVNHGWHSLDAGNNYASKSEDVPFVTNLSSFIKDDNLQEMNLDSVLTQCYMLPAGNYYLNGSLTLQHPIYIDGSNSVIICLNGQTINGPSNAPAIYSNGELHICDCKSNGKITGVSNAVGAIVAKGSFSFHNGKITGNTTRGVFAYGPVNIYGGEISNNTRISDHGAGVWMYGSTLNMYDGKISNNTINASNNSKGGGVYIYGGAQFNMSGGEISDNKIIMKDYDGIIKSSGEGGGVYIDKSGFNMSGGTILRNKAKNYGGVYFEPKNITEYMTISGNAIIKDNIASNDEYNTGDYDSNVFLYAASYNSFKYAKFLVSAPLGDSAEIHFRNPWIDSINENFVVAESTTDGILKPEDAVKFVHEVSVSSSSKPSKTSFLDGKIILEAPHVHALNVGCDSSVTAGSGEVTFTKVLTSNESNQLCVDGNAIDKYDSVRLLDPNNNNTGKNVSGYTLTGGDSAAKAVNYYVQSDMEIDAPIIIDKHVNICLNGHVIKNTGTSSVFIVASGSLSICDCQPKTQHPELTGELAGITGGLITGGKSNTTYGYGHGGGIYNYGTLNMYSGTIAGNSASSCGGGISSVNTLNMYGGTVSNNEAGSIGGGIYVKKANGVSICNASISHVTIANNTAQNGGGLYFASHTSSKISDSTITGNTAVAEFGNGGGIYASGIDKNKSMTISNCQITNNSATYKGGGVFTADFENDNNKKLIISGSTNISQNKVGEQTNNIYLSLYRQPICITAENLSSGAYLGVTTQTPPTEEKPIAITNAVDSTYAKYFYADDSEHYHVAWNEDKGYLELVAGATLHNHNELTFTSLPEITDTLSAGNHYLTGNITDTVTISGTVNLCLNGNDFTGLTDKPAFKVPANGVLNLFDCQPDVFAKLAKTGGIEVATGGKVAITNADGSKKDEYTATKDGVVKVEEGGTITPPQDVSTDHIHNGNVYTPTSTISNPLGAGYYYLTQDINLSQTITVTSGAAYICLNGYKITGPATGPAFKVANGATLNLANDEGKAENNTDGFKGLAGSGGIEVAGGGTLNMIAKDPANNVNYAPAAGTAGGKVTVGEGGAVDKPDDGPHAERHPELKDATEINEANFNNVTQEYSPGIHKGTLPDNKTAYRYLNGGQYYLEGNFTMPNALVVLNATDFCLNGSNLGADNDTWIYEMQHIFWVPEKAVLNVLDCQRNLEIVWLYGGRVFLKNGGKVNISGKIPDYITTIEMDDKSEGEVKVENNAQKKPIMTLPEGATLTQKKNNTPTQTIKNNDGVLEISTPTAEAPTQITPPANKTVDLRLEEPAADEEAPNIVLEAPAKTTVQTEDGPEITLEQPGEVAADGTVTAPEVTVADEEEHTIVKITATENQDIKVDTKGEAQAPAGSTVTVDHVIIKIEAVGGTDPNKAATVSPSGDVQLPAGTGSEVTITDPSKGNASITIALPNEGGEIGVTDSGVTLPADSKVEVKNKENVKIVIALPNLEGDEQPSIDFGNGGTLILPPGTKVTVDGKETEVDKDNPVFNPDTGELTDKEPENPDRPTEPVHPNNPPDDAQVVTPEQPVDTPDAKVEVDDQGEITITPTDSEKPAVVIKPQPPTDPDKPGETPKPPVVDETGKVYIDEPFKVETEDGPDITAENGGSVDPDGNVTGEKVTVEQKNPDGTKKETTLTAPEGDAVKVGPDGEAQAPVGTEVENEDVTVKIDKVPDPTKPVPVKPDGSIDLPGGSEITVTPENPQQPEQNYTVKLPEQGGEVKLNKDKDDNVTITLPPGTKVIDQNGRETTISNNGGTLNLSTGDITGGLPNGGNSGGSGGGGSSSASYVITASASIGGEISPDKRVVVSRGADQTFTIKPNEGYVLSDVLVDSKSVGQVTSYTFENVRAGHTIQALFVAEGMAGHGHQGDCPKDETCPIWPYTDSIPTAWYHDGVHYCIEKSLMIGTAPKEWETNIPLSRAMMAQVLYNKAGRPAVSGEGVFDDVDQEWYWPAITWGGRNDVLWGYGDGNYGPQDPITREQLATLLWRFAGQPQTSEQLSFSDAAEASDYAKQALSWASQHGVITGYPDGTFRPQDNTSRAEAAQMIMRYFNL